MYGEEPFLIEESVKALSLPFSGFERFAAPESIDLGSLYQAVATVSLFSTPKLIILRNPGFLSDSMSDADVAQFSLILESVKQQGHGFIIYLLNKKLDQRKKSFGVLKKNAQLHDFPAFKEWEQDKVIAFIQKTAKEKGKVIEPNAAFALEEMGGGQLQVLANEIEKLIVYTGNEPKITLADVKALHAGQLSSFYDLSQAMQSGEFSKMVQIVESLLHQHEDAVKILGAMAANFRLYLQLSLLDSEGKSADDMGRITGKNPYFIKRLIAPIKKSYTIEHLKSAMLACAKADLEIKSGVMRPPEAIEVLVITLTVQFQRRSPAYVRN